MRRSARTKTATAGTIDSGLAVLRGDELFQRFDDQRVVVLLGQARDRDSTDGPGADASSTQRERAPVGSKTVEVEARRLIEGGTPGTEACAYQERARTVTLHDPSLTVDPRVVVGARPGKGAMEELLRCGTDIDRNWGSPLTGHFDQERPEAPRV